jgi:hypothetical protein
MGNLRRFRGGLLRVLSVFLIVLACCWLALYIDSVHQRRRAERFLLDLRSFPFASAGFVEVRDLAIRHGGAGLQDLPQRFPLSCTIRDCTFEVWIKHRLLRLSLEPSISGVGLLHPSVFRHPSVWSFILGLKLKMASSQAVSRR